MHAIIIPNCVFQKENSYLPIYSEEKDIVVIGKCGFSKVTSKGNLKWNPLTINKNTHTFLKYYLKAKDPLPFIQYTI